MSSVKPAENVHAIFGGHFYRMISPEHEDFIISPGAVLKLLMTVSLGANVSLSDQILWGLHIKHVDEKRLREEAERAGIFDMGFTIEIREKLELELSDYIEREKLLDFFKNDFTELGERVAIKNFIIADGALQFKEDYRNFMQQYFKTTLVQRNKPEELRLIEQRFSEVWSDKSLDIVGSASFKFNFGMPFRMHDDGSFEAIGSFKYNEIENNSSISFRAEVLEIPLECSSTVPLTMLIFLPNDFGTLLKQSIGRDYRDFNKISQKLSLKCVKVKLPKIKMEQKIELSNFFAETSHRGLRKFFNEPIILDRIFENAEENELLFGKYWQHTSLEMTAPRADKNENDKAPPAPDFIFDATNKSFLFVIRSDKVLYVVGHYLKRN